LLSLSHKIKQKMEVKSAAKAVYLGPRMPQDTKEHIREICKKIGDIPCYDTKLDNTEYRIITTESK